MSERQKEMAYWGWKFEQYVTAGTYSISLLLSFFIFFSNKFTNESNSALSQKKFILQFMYLKVYNIFFHVLHDEVQVHVYQIGTCAFLILEMIFNSEVFQCSRMRPQITVSLFPNCKIDFYFPCQQTNLMDCLKQMNQSTTVKHSVQQSDLDWRSIHYVRNMPWKMLSKLLVEVKCASYRPGISTCMDSSLVVYIQALDIKIIAYYRRLFPIVQ